MATEPDYLDPSFEPSSVTVPRLRNILLEHGVQYNSSAKKPDLIALFNEHVAPKASKILKSRSRTKRSTKGIEDVPSSQSSTLDDAEDEVPVLPTLSTVKRTSRRTTRAATEEEGDKTLVPGLPATTRGKTPSKAAKHARETSDVEVEERPAARRTRHSVTPAVKDEESEPETWHRHDDTESPFTADNPFQSGSSPLQADTRPDRRRRTLGLVEKEKRKSSTARRRTEQPRVEQQDDGIVVPTRRTFEMPATQLKRERASLTPSAQIKRERVSATPSGLEPGEEFTPEETMDLVHEQEQNGDVAVLPPRRKKQPAKSTGTLKAGIWAVSLALAGGLGTVWRQEKLAVGYCGVGRDQPSLAGIDIPEWVNDFIPQCEPCPPHAYCYGDLETVCEPDFILKPHPFSLNGLVPLAPTCEPDSEKARRISQVTDRTVEILRDRRAKWECGGLTDGDGNPIPAVEMSEQELKDEMSAKRRKSMSQQEFEDLWTGAIGEIEKREEVVTNTDGITGRRTLTSTSTANLPLGCSLRLWVRESLERHIWQLIGIVLFFASGSYGWSTITYGRQTEVRAKKLAKYALDRLASHAALNSQEPGAYPEVGISMTQLRDDVLRDEFSAKRRQKLWEKVQSKVEHNSNVRAAVREGRSGDVTRMWEWIGPVEYLEDGRGSGRRDSGRRSLGPVVGSSPARVGTPLGDEMRQAGKWDEGRPIY
ncbi:sister chromatid separation protein-like protein [Mytilinidion resinicola]|uniref:Sister chromatid separation protein-like protein n=1 Tax=Mytilinidion resinicola TaxID=574789 RepID=A0A6A6XZT1_9PEZI|nr:sister chromatid separation protein-like protein [Mytilinidion resinicola]KAF2801909.1 sister chromatid separation protein-like protein [Mytilinidion resinicola]